MRLITRCPQCETTFRVIPDQLKLAQGWVRCGRCTRVFEADQHLFEVPAAPPPAVDVPTARPVQLQDDKMAKRKAVKTFWGWWVLGSALGLLLALQWGFQARHVLAAQFPELRQPLQAMCDTLHCEVAWPLDLPAVSLVSSSFEQRAEDRYRLTLQWRNLNSYPVATPSVELSLTDAQDQPVVRKVLTPESLNLPAFITPGGLKSMAFDLDGASAEFQSVVGYRVVLFYP
jgi:predicted Zn finger-like uncharacterized protein